MYDTPDDLLREILAGEDSFLDWKEVFVKGGGFVSRGRRLTLMKSPPWNWPRT